MNGVLHRVMKPRRHLPHWLRLSRYTVGSLICFAIAEVVFVALFWPHVLGARGAAVVASIAGVIPGYYLNRTWTWGRQQRSNFWREVVPYWTIAVTSTILAALATGAANSAAIDEPRATRTLINGGAYMAAYGVIFVAKYLIFHNWLFKPSSPVALGGTGDEVVIDDGTELAAYDAARAFEYARED
jgi:putative flippase GtrA